MNKKIIKNILVVIGFILLGLCIWVGAAYGRFKYEESHTNINQALKDPNTLTIVYKDDCHRCKETLPKIFLKHPFSLKGENIINLNRVSSKKKDSIPVYKTPGFLYQGNVYETTNVDQINHIWVQSHK